MEQKLTNGCSFARDRKKKSQEEESREHQRGTLKTCKRLRMALFNNPCSGLGQQEQQWAKPSLGRGEGRQELLSRRAELQGLLTSPLYPRKKSTQHFPWK